MGVKYALCKKSERDSVDYRWNMNAQIHLSIISKECWYNIDTQA
jgi:hypothetical protein